MQNTPIKHAYVIYTNTPTTITLKHAASAYCKPALISGARVTMD